MGSTREKNLLRNTAILSIGTFVPKAFSFIITPLLTGNLTKEEYGHYDLIMTLVSLLLPAITLQITTAAFRFLIDARNDEKEMRGIISNIYLFITITTTVTASLFYFLYGYKLGINGAFVCLYFVVNMYLQATQQIMRGLGKNYVYSISSIINSGVNVILLVVLIGGYFFNNIGLTGVIISMLLSELVATMFLIVFGNIKSYITFNEFSKTTIKRMLSYSWPMVPNNLSGWVLRLSDRLVITYFLGVESNAIYAVANKFPALITSLQSVLIYAWQENASLAASDNDKDSYYSKMCNDLFYIFVGFVSVLIAITPLIWKILIRGDYTEAYYQMPVLYLGIFFSSMSSIIGGIYIAHKRTKNVGITTMFAAAINLIIDLGFVNVIGIWAGSISTMVSYLILLVYRMINVQQFQRVSFKIKNILIGLFFIIIMSILSMQKTLIMDAINVGIAIIVLILFDRQFILAFLNKIRGRRVGENETFN